MELPRVHELLRIIRPEMTLASNRSPVSYSDVFFGEWEMDKMQHFMEHTHLPISIAVNTVYLLFLENREFVVIVKPDALCIPSAMRPV